MTHSLSLSRSSTLLCPLLLFSVCLLLLVVVQLPPDISGSDTSFEPRMQLVLFGDSLTQRGSEPCEETTREGERERMHTEEEERQRKGEERQRVELSQQSASSILRVPCVLCVSWLGDVVVSLLFS